MGLLEALGIKKGSPPKKKSAKILEDYRVGFRLSIKGKPTLGSIDGTATVTAENPTEAEKILKELILEDINILFTNTRRV